MRRDMESRWDFEALVERADLDMTELAAAEDLLRGAPAEPVSREWIAATVERVTAPARRRRYWLPQRLPLVAAILLGMLVCTAAVTVALWSGRNSSFEMTYPVAIRLLLEPQHEESDRMGESDRVAALMVVRGRVLFGIAQLHEAAEDPDLAEAANRALAHVEGALLATPAGSPEPVDESMKAAAAQALDKGRDIADRWQSIAQLGRLTESGVLAVRMVKPDPTVDAHRTSYLKQFHRDLIGK